MFNRDVVGAVYVSVKKNMDRFLEAVTSIMAYLENSYGNLSFIHFKKIFYLNILSLSITFPFPLTCIHSLVFASKFAAVAD